MASIKSTSVLNTEYDMNRFHDFFSKQSVIVLAMIFFALIFTFFATIYLHAEGHPRLGDHYFHVKYADVLIDEKTNAVFDFQWVFFSKLAQNHERYGITLFHILIVPLVYIFNILTALKLVDVLCITSAITIVYVSLAKMNVKYPVFFALLLLAIPSFMGRFFLGRAFTLVAALIILEVYYAVTKKEKALAIVSILHVLLHQSTFFMPIIAVGSVEVARYLIDFKMYIKNIIFVIVTVIIAMIFFPNFPTSIIDSLANIVNIQSQNAVEAESIGGNEVQKRDFFSTFSDMKIVLGMIILSIFSVVSLYIQRKINNKEYKNFNKEQLIITYALFLLLIGFFFGGIAISARFLDFLMPVVVVLVALIFTILVNSGKIIVEKHVANSIKYSIIIFCLIMFTGNVIDFVRVVNNTDSSHIKNAADWIGERSVDDEVVFLFNWSDFNWMFFYNSNVNYSTGRDPVLLKEYDEDLYWKYYNIFKNIYYCEDNENCAKKATNMREYMKTAKKEDQVLIKKENSRKIIESVRNDFNSRFIVSRSAAFNSVILLNNDLIEDKFVSNARYGKSKITVFKLK